MHSLHLYTFKDVIIYINLLKGTPSNAFRHCLLKSNAPSVVLHSESLVFYLLYYFHFFPNIFCNRLYLQLCLIICPLGRTIYSTVESINATQILQNAPPLPLKKKCIKTMTNADNQLVLSVIHLMKMDIYCECTFSEESQF